MLKEPNEIPISDSYTVNSKQLKERNKILSISVNDFWSKSVQHFF